MNFFKKLNLEIIFICLGKISMKINEFIMNKKHDTNHYRNEISAEQIKLKKAFFNDKNNNELQLDLVVN